MPQVLKSLHSYPRTTIFPSHLGRIRQIHARLWNHCISTLSTSTLHSLSFPWKMLESYTNVTQFILQQSSSTASASISSFPSLTIICDNPSSLDHQFMSDPPSSLSAPFSHHYGERALHSSGQYRHQKRFINTWTVLSFPFFGVTFGCQPAPRVL